MATPYLKDLLNAIYGLYPADEEPELRRPGELVAAVGLSHMDALAQWSEKFSEYLSEAATQHDYQHLIWWYEPLDVAPEGSVYLACARLVIW